MDNYNLYFLLGIIVGLAIVAIVCTVIWGANKNPKYDERQQRAQGKAYKAAFWTILVYLCIIGIYDSVFGQWGDFIVEAFTGICLGVMVYANICIFTDSYFAPNKKRSQYLSLFGVVAVINAAIVAINAACNLPFTTEGLLNFRVMNIVVLLMFVVLFISLLIKGAVDAKRTDEE